MSELSEVSVELDDEGYEITEDTSASEIRGILDSNSSMNVMVTRWQLRGWLEELLGLEAKCLSLKAQLREVSKNDEE